MNLRSPGGRLWGREGGSWDGHVHTTVLKMDHQQGPAVEPRELCSMPCSSLDGRGIGGEWTLLFSYTPLQFFFFLREWCYG